MPPAKPHRTTCRPVRSSRKRRVRRNARQRRGQSLLEFALVALVTYLLLAAIITFGFLFYAAQGSQSAVDSAAREFSRTPLPAVGVRLADVLSGPTTEPSIIDARKRVFDEHYLVLFEEDVLDEATRTYDMSVIRRLPLINQQLLPLMIFEEIEGNRVFRYPGAICRDADPGDDPEPVEGVRLTGFLIAIPLVSRDVSGTETITWVRPLEPMVQGVLDGEPEDIDPFLITSPERGIVGLRLNYPVQSSVMSAHVPNPAGPFEPTVGSPLPATDMPNGGKPPQGMSLITRPLINTQGTADPRDDTYAGTYGGTYGLGAHGAMGQVVRPFRRVISAQAIYRREVFE